MLRERIVLEVRGQGCSDKHRDIHGSEKGVSPGIYEILSKHFFNPLRVIS